jgi:site-specific DNA-cytosine methylase
MTLYNDNDPKVCAWLRELINAGHLPPGDVLCESITEVRPDDIARYSTVHFFAGIGGWPLALRLAGWPDDRPVWTGSCPCQPFSAAGKRKGHADERHLWPAMFGLIRECKPPVVFGEQVASPLVIGANVAARKDVQDVLDQQAIVRVLHERGWLYPEHLYRLRQREMQNEATGDLFDSSSVRSRQDAGVGGEVPSSQDGSAVRSGLRRHSEANRDWSMRVDGSSVRPLDAEGLEHPVSGPDQAGRGVHKGKCAGCAVCPERNGSQLGASEDRGDGRGNQESEVGPLERLIRTHRGAAEGQPADWFSRVRDDLGAAGYSIGACLLAASSVGAPHIRQRLFWVADATNDGPPAYRSESSRATKEGRLLQPERCHRRLADAESVRAGPRDDGQEPPSEFGRNRPAIGGTVGGMGDADNTGLEGRRLLNGGRASKRTACQASQWDGAINIPCGDGKTRRIEPGTPPLVDGIPARVVRRSDKCTEVTSEIQGEARVIRLRGYGNAIVPQVAAEFIAAFMEVANAND